jgi:hypothetical protein
VNRPRPVLTAASIAAAVHALAAIVAFLGYTNIETNLDGSAETIGALVVGAITVGAHLIAGFSAQSHVTPLADPKTVTGESLVPASSATAVRPVMVQVDGKRITSAINSAAVASSIDDTPIPLDPELEDDVASEDTSTAPAEHVAEHAG